MPRPRRGAQGADAPRPHGPGAFFGVLGQLRGGSAVDAPLGLIGAAKAMVRGTPADSPLTVRDVKASPDYVRIWTTRLREGEQAPDFELAQIEAGELGARVRLSSYRHRQPVALLFGSYTSPAFRTQLQALEQIASRFRDQVAFFIVYVKEAHAEGAWVQTYNRRSGISFEEPQTLAERAAVARTLVERMGTSIPVLVDEPDNGVADEYGGWPSRLYLVGRDGRIAFQGGEGPFGVKPAELEQAIQRELGS